MKGFSIINLTITVRISRTFIQYTGLSYLGENLVNAQEKFMSERILHWNKVASLSEGARNWGSTYHTRLLEIYRHIIPENQRVIELGCGKGDFLAELKPSFGVGIDFSPVMVKKAKKVHSDFTFLVGDVHDIKIREKFDYIILSDLLNDLWDVQKVFDQMKKLCHAKTRILINTYSRLWSPVLGAASDWKCPNRISSKTGLRLKISETC